MHTTQPMPSATSVILLRRVSVSTIMRKDIYPGDTHANHSRLFANLGWLIRKSAGDRPTKGLCQQAWMSLLAIKCFRHAPFELEPLLETVDGNAHGVSERVHVKGRQGCILNVCLFQGDEIEIEPDD